MWRKWMVSMPLKPLRGVLLQFFYLQHSRGVLRGKRVQDVFLTPLNAILR